MTKEQVISALVSFFNFNVEEAKKQVESYQQLYQIQEDHFSLSTPNIIAVFD